MPDQMHHMPSVLCMLRRAMARLTKPGREVRDVQKEDDRCKHRAEDDGQNAAVQGFGAKVGQAAWVS